MSYTTNCLRFFLYFTKHDWQHPKRIEIFWNLNVKKKIYKINVVREILSITKRHNGIKRLTNLCKLRNSILKWLKSKNQNDYVQYWLARWNAKRITNKSNKISGVNTENMWQNYVRHAWETFSRVSLKWEKVSVSICMYFDRLREWKG